MESPLPLQTTQEDAIDFGDLVRRLCAGLPQMLGLALLGLAIATGAYFVFGQFISATTSSRVVFSFPGLEKGEYPDKSKFQADDIRSPEIVAEALKRQGLESDQEVQSRIRASLSISGIIPDSTIKERDKLRAIGQPVPLFVPDEYVLALSLPRKYPLTPRQRELLLNEIVSVYQEKFTRTYVTLPISFGKAFDALNDADYFDYELVLNQESQNISAFLQLLAGLTPQTADHDAIRISGVSRSFRSARSNFSFSDLLKQNQLFIQIRLNETLGLIRQYGLSKNRQIALLKMDYYLKTLSDQENQAAEEEKVVQALLKQTQERMQNYVLGVKSQAVQQRPDSPIIDQGLIDSLLANDANNFLVRKSLDASLKTRRIQSEKAILQDQRNNMQTFLQSDQAQKTETLAQFQRSLASLKEAYERLINNIRITYEDFQRQQYGDAVRMSMQTSTESIYRGLFTAGIFGLGVGASLGFGLSLLGIYIGRTPRF